MTKLIDADATRRIILSHGGNDAMLREIERLPDVDVIPCAFLERYFNWYCGPAPLMPEAIRSAIKFYHDSCGARMVKRREDGDGDG